MLNFYECNVKGGYNAQRCGWLRFTTGGAPGADQGAAIIHDNADRGAVKVHAGRAGDSNAKCNAHTNGQCAIVAVPYNSDVKVLIKSPIIKFAKP